MPNTRASQPRPIELLSRVDLAARSDIGMRKNAMRRNPAAAHNIEAKSFNGRHLSFGKIRVTAIAPRIMNLDPDRTRIDVVLALPMGHARVPGAKDFRHHLRYNAGIIDHIVTGPARFGRRQPLDRGPGRRHASVVQEKDVRPKSVSPCLEILAPHNPSDYRRIWGEWAPGIVFNGGCSATF
jgi:hypothetical protein